MQLVSRLCWDALLSAGRSEDAPVAPAHLLLLVRVCQRVPQIAGHQLLDHVQLAAAQKCPQELNHRGVPVDPAHQTLRHLSQVQAATDLPGVAVHLTASDGCRTQPALTWEPC